MIVTTIVTGVIFKVNGSSATPDGNPKGSEKEYKQIMDMIFNNGIIVVNSDNRILDFEKYNIDLIQERSPGSIRLPSTLSNMFILKPPGQIKVLESEVTAVGTRSKYKGKQQLSEYYRRSLCLFKGGKEEEMNIKTIEDILSINTTLLGKTASKLGLLNCIVVDPLSKRNRIEYESRHTKTHHAILDKVDLEKGSYIVYRDGIFNTQSRWIGTRDIGVLNLGESQKTEHGPAIEKDTTITLIQTSSEIAVKQKGFQRGINIKSAHTFMLPFISEVDIDTITEDTQKHRVPTTINWTLGTTQSINEIYARKII